MVSENLWLLRRIKSPSKYKNNTIFFIFYFIFIIDTDYRPLSKQWALFNEFPYSMKVPLYQVSSLLFQLTGVLNSNA